MTAPQWCGCAALWLGAWALVEVIVRRGPRRGWAGRAAAVAVPAIFGATLLFWWEAIVRGLGVPAVILPPPSAIAARIAASPGLLAADFAQTMKGLAAGYIAGCGGGALVALAIDRVPFLQRGLLPLGTFASALPVVGVAPIMVMWFGFDWPSKAAVVAAMTFFPMLVNCDAGLRATTALDRDLMSTWAAPYGVALRKMRLPAALPFVFNGLKLCTTLALIGAVVAEFFGTPIVGMGFRINAEVGRMNIDTVWAAITVAALSGTLLYGLVALVERRATFWHPSFRGRRS
jgi:NitT/TauT family transport system permease protein